MRQKFSEKQQHKLCPLPIVIKDLKAVDVKDADDRVLPHVPDTAELGVNRLIDATHNPREHPVIESLQQARHCQTIR